MNSPLNELTKKYIEGAPKLRHALAGLSETEMKSYPISNTWSIKEISMHLVDTEIVYAERIRKILSENNPLILAFDQSSFSKSLFYNDLDVVLGAEILEKIRILTGGILCKLNPIDFQRTGVHNEVGKKTLSDFIESTCNHLDMHIQKIHEKRKLLGK